MKSRVPDIPEEIRDEPGMAERFQRGLRNLINTPPKPRKPAAPKPKERQASKGRRRKAVDQSN